MKPENISNCFGKSVSSRNTGARKLYLQAKIINVFARALPLSLSYKLVSVTLCGNGVCVNVHTVEHTVKRVLSSNLQQALLSSR